MASEVGSTVLGAVVRSLGKLLKYELGLAKTVKNGITSLQSELRCMDAFLGDGSRMPPDQLESQLQLRAREEVRELSHAIQTRLHSFLLRIESTEGQGSPFADVVRKLRKRKIKHEIASYIKDTQKKVKEMRDRYAQYSSMSSRESTSTRKGDTRRFAKYTAESNPVGIDGPIADLTEKLSKIDHVSIVGMGGLGKTTLARALYDKMKGRFDCRAFVHFGQSADVENVLKDILYGLHMDKDGKEPNIHQPIDRLQNFMLDKRCLIVIDDIWDEGKWNFINGVIKDSAGTKIITTTRNLKIAEEVGGVYPIKPLSPDKSKELLRTKAEVISHDTEFDEVSDKILRKCGGVPIAITMIGSFLANNKSKGWHGAYDSIGFDEHKKDGAFEHIRKVLSCSYYNLPYNIQKCLLYLSLFPEDHWIEKNMLIWRWVAEDLISDGLFETGEAHFSELIDRSIIQSAVSPRDVGQGGCRVHSLMLDLIRDLSSSKNENFATVLGMKQESTSETVRIHRLAIHKTSVAQNQNTSLEVGEVLSLYASTYPGSSFPPLWRFKRLRVIDLEDCDLSVEDCKLTHLEKLAGLAYIGLVGTHVAELPKKMGCLKFLQTLDLTATGLSELPTFIGDLKKLRCLRVGKGTRIMGRIGELTSLEELWLHSADKFPGFAIELRKLTELRVLVIHFDEIDDGKKEALVESLHELKKLQVLQVWSDTEEKVPLGSWEGSMPSPQLRQLLLFGVILPRPMSWIHRLSVPKLSKILLQVETLEKKHLEVLGKMSSLRSLYLHSEDDKYRLSYTANKNEFKVLEYINTNIELICGDGGLPMIQELEVGGIRAGRDVGLRGNMPLLQRATYHLDCVGRLPLRVQKAEKELWQAGEAHPNRPEITIRRWNNVVTEIWPKMEQMKGTSVRLVRPSAPQENRFLDIPELLKQMSEDFARLELDNPIGAPPALRVDDATDATDSPFQGAALIEYYFKSMLKVHEDSTDMMPNEGLSSPGSASSSDADADASSEGNDGAGPSREPPPEPDTTNALLSTVLSWFNSPDGAAKMSKEADRHGMDLVAYKRIWKKCVLNPELIAVMGSLVQKNDISEYKRLHGQLLEQEIWDYFAGHDIDEPSSPPGYAGSSREPPPPKVDADNMHSWLVGMYGAAHVSALMFKGAAEFGMDPADFETVWKKFVLNPELVAPMDSALQNNDRSEFERLMAQVEAENTRPPPKLDIYDTFLHWRNTPDGATAMSEGAAEFGMDPAAFERILKKCVLKPELIADMDSALQDDDGSWMELMEQLMEPETMHYFTEQYMDGPSSTPGYAYDGRADASSTSAPLPEISGQDGEKVSRMLRQVLPTVEQVLKAGESSRQPSAAKVIADNELNNGGAADASGMLSSLSSSPAFAAQYYMMDALASSTASEAESRQDGDNSSTIFNLNEQLAIMEKALAANESNGNPSSGQVDADGVLSPGGPVDASDTLSGLSSDPALADQSDLIDAVAISTGQGGEISSTTLNLNELLATLEKAAAAGESNKQPCSAQVNADSMLSRRGSPDASGMLSGLSSDPSLAAQYDTMDDVASRAASVAQSRQDGENSSTIFNLNEPLGAFEDSTDGPSSRQPSSAQRKQYRGGRWRRRVNGLQNQPRVP